YLSIISIAIPFVYLNNLTGVLLNSLRMERITMLTTFLGLIVNVVLNFMLIPQLKIFGAVYSTILTEASLLIFQTIFLIKLRKDNEMTYD
ncbi:MAG: polysaccharide biosynthesis C-terminal domain-containing protein, partial [Ignavibacterium sp.]|nr:polysaccharide biosynthesis C-terminal domain-containing protein [Ignavibacterium sp.]